MVLPFLGFLTRRALRCATPKVPNPEMITRSPRTRLLRIPATNASNARAAWARVNRASKAIFPTSSLLVTRHTLNARE